ncbi:MAG: hypothetical protein RIC55_31165 [Pirellulaceae bacterium]
MSDAERKQAVEYNRRLAQEVARRFLWRLGLMAFCAGAAAIVWYVTKSVVFAFPPAGMAAFFGIMALEAWDTWREVRRRDWHRLSPLRRSTPATSARTDMRQQ